jgi:hypothetical protein
MTNPIPMSKDDAKGFFGELFDFSFKTWVTLRVAGVLYAISVIVIAIFALVTMISLFGSGDMLMIFFALVGVPIITLLAILLVRIGFEGAIANIAIAKNTTPRN